MSSAASTEWVKYASEISPMAKNKNSLRLPEESF